MNLKNGFTLAEVLITLVIIGVIAALTIPALMNKTNEQETVVAVKKAFSVISQASQRIVAENGEITSASLGANNAVATETLGGLFAKFLNVQTVCGTSTDGDCAFESYKFFNYPNYLYTPNTNDYYKIVLSDGMFFFIGGKNPTLVRGNTDPLSNIVGLIDVDVNGNKGPNIVGKDVFSFYITKYGVVPAGTPDDTFVPFSSCRRSGWGCTAWVIAKGNVDYWYKEVSW